MTDYHHYYYYYYYFRQITEKYDTLQTIQVYRQYRYTNSTGVQTVQVYRQYSSTYCTGVQTGVQTGVLDRCIRLV